jgi:hypothetical protein
MEDIRQLIFGMADLIDFTAAGAGKSLGDDCLDRVVERIQDRSLGEQMGADGQGWDDNAPRYKRGPKKRGKPVGVLSGEMLSDVQLAGERTIEPHRAVMVYGQDDEHRNRANYFERGSDGPGDGPTSGAVNQPPRPGMYALDDQAVDDVMDTLGEWADRRLAALHRGR